jgi:protein-tyrosine kinase
MERISEALQRARQERNAERVVFRDAARSVSASVDGAQQAAAKIVYTHTRCVDVPRDTLARQRIVTGFAPCMYTDAFKILSTHVSQKLREHNWNTIAVTSPNEHEGKTLVAVNLAISLAMEFNQTALLVDADLRRPSIRGTFGLQPGPGLSDYLISHTPVEQLLIHPGIDGFVMLPGGQPLLNSSELLAGRQMAELVKELKNRYRSRIVLFDLPPLLSAADVLAFAPHVDAALLVVEEGRTLSEDVTRAAELLSGTHLIGTVLNKSAGLRVPADKEYRLIEPPDGRSKSRSD